MAAAIPELCSSTLSITAVEAAVIAPPKPTPSSTRLASCAPVTDW
ncbi:Uncharacterised protein [Klebsiella pneumoniae]|nr:Uncharacterised protein [Klebsiella pneumoniae]